MRRSIRAAMLCTLVALILFGGSAPVEIHAQEALFRDDFETTPNRNWTAVTDTVELAFGDGLMLLDVSSESVVGVVMTRRRFAGDVTVSAEFVIPDGRRVEEWNAGLILRADQQGVQSGWLQFQITGDGGWDVVERPRSRDSFVTKRSGVLPGFRGDAVHRLSVTVTGNEFAFTVNGRVVTTIENTTTNADSDDYFVGALIGTFTGLDALSAEIDNFTVTRALREPTATPTPDQVEVGNYLNILLDELFDNNANAWGIDKRSESEARIANSVLEVTMLTGGTDGLIRWIAPEQQFTANTDVSVVMIADLTKSKGQWGAGVVVRVQYDDESDESSFYSLMINQDANWYVARLDTGSYETVLQPKPLDGLTLNEPITLRAVIVGEQIVFFVNQVQVAQVTNENAPTRSYGVGVSIAVPDEESSATVRFDEFIVLGE